MVANVIKTEAGVFAIGRDNSLIPFSDLGNENNRNAKICPDGIIKIIPAKSSDRWSSSSECNISEDENRECLRDYDYNYNLYQKFLESVSVHRRDIQFTEHVYGDILEFRVPDSDLPFEFFRYPVAILNTNKINISKCRGIKSLYILDSNFNSINDLKLFIPEKNYSHKIDEVRFDRCNLHFGQDHLISRRTNFYKSKIVFHNIDFATTIDNYDLPVVNLNWCEAEADYIKYSSCSCNPINLLNNSSLTIDKLDWKDCRDLSPSISDTCKLHIKELVIDTSNCYGLDFSGGAIQIDKITKVRSGDYYVKGHRGMNLIIEGKQIKSSMRV